MTKTPISILQELMIAKKTVPNYEYIDIGENNTFTCKVSCDGLVVKGSGRSKKLAKHEAAKAMLKLIHTYQTVQPQLQSTPASLKRSLPAEVTDSPKVKRISNFFNAVGALTELCIEKKMSIPSYEVRDVGPPHAKTFTVICTISTLKEEGIASSKKEAKQEAAKKMLKKIQTQGIKETNEIILPEVLKKIQKKIQVQDVETVKNPITSFENKIPVKFEVIVENLKYLDKVDLPSIENNLKESEDNKKIISKIEEPNKIIQIDIKEESPEYVKKNYDEKTRSQILKQVNYLHKLIHDGECDATEEFVNYLRKKFIDILKLLKFTYKSIRMQTISTTKCLVLVEVSTNPDISEVGVAKNFHQAEMNGIKQILEILKKFV